MYTVDVSDKKKLKEDLKYCSELWAARVALALLDELESSKTKTVKQETLPLLNVDRGLVDGAVFATCPHCNKTIYWDLHIQEGVNFCSRCGGRVKMEKSRYDNNV